MPLSPSWKTHVLQGLAAANAIGDRNAGKFTEAMTHDAAIETKMKYLYEDNNLILVEDIIDTGRTMKALLNTLAKLEPKSVTVAGRVGLVKPAARSPPVLDGRRGNPICRPRETGLKRSRRQSPCARRGNWPVH